MNERTASPYLRFPTKILEVRDRGTFMPVLAVRLLVRAEGHRHNMPMTIDPAIPAHLEINDDAEEYLLRRVGYATKQIHGEGEPYVILTKLDGGTKAEYDPFAWGNRTWQVAHSHIIKNWDTLVSGQVVDVEFILRETSEPKVSERLTW